METQWFSADKEGLARLMKRRGMAWALFEVTQNALDQNVTEVKVTLEREPKTAYAWLTCEDDDPAGFENLKLAWTLFADTGKRSDPTKAGRFTMGEKMVLALATEARIVTTTGSVFFNQKEGRKISKKSRERGSYFEARLPLTKAEYEEVCAAAKTILPRPGVKLSFNGEIIPAREAVRSFPCELQTEFADENRVLRRTRRKTTVSLFELLPNEKATLYELGLPVVPLEGGEKWHVHVHQRVPLNAERDNVTPAYLGELRTFVLNEMHGSIKGDEATAPWVRDAAADTKVSPEAIETVITERFGKKRVIFDPTDPEGTKIAVSKDFTVITGGALSAGEWQNVKKHGVALPAGQVTPSPKPFDPNGDPLKLIPEDRWTPYMMNIADFTRTIGKKVLERTVSVQITNDAHWPFAATYGRREGQLIFNAGRLGHRWFERGRKDPEVLGLILHELAHHYSGDHLAEEFHDGICKVGAAMTLLAFETPELFLDR